MSELKPCPFCGSEDIEIYHDSFSDYWVVECRDCGGDQDRLWDKEAAVEFWNTRPAEDAKDKKIELLKAALSDISQITFDGRIGDKIAREAIQSIAKCALAPDMNVGTIESKGEDK